MDMYELGDAERYLHHNPPIHELIGDWFGKRTRPKDETPPSAAKKKMSAQAKRARLKQIENEWRK